MLFMYQEQVVFRAFIGIHIFGQNPMPAGFENRFFVVAPKMRGAEWAYSILADFAYHVFVGIIRPVCGIFKIDE